MINRLYLKHNVLTGCYTGFFVRGEKQYHVRGMGACPTKIMISDGAIEHCTK